MEYKKIISSFIISIMLFVNLVSCNDTDSSADSGSKQDVSTQAVTVFSSNSGHTSGEIGSLSLCDYTASKTTFNIDDVSLTFHFGFLWYPNISTHYFYGEYFPYVDLSFAYYPNDFDNSPDYDNKTQIFLKRVENIMAEEYRCLEEYNEEKDLYFWKYNHSEELAVPNELFAEDEGWIFLEVYYLGTNEQNGEPLVLSSHCGFYYSKQSDYTIKIYFSAKEANQ